MKKDLELTANLSLKKRESSNNLTLHSHPVLLVVILVAVKEFTWEDQYTLVKGKESYLPRKPIYHRARRMFPFPMPLENDIHKVY